MSVTTAPPEILTRLRQETRPYHDTLEQNPFNQQLLAGTVSADTTRWFLERLYGFLAPYETWLRQQAADFGPDWEIEHRYRAGLILQDLQPTPAAALPRCPQLPPLDTRAQLLGAMYVLEGSTLGGQVITRQLAQAGIPLRAYFSGYGELTGPRWKRFVQLLAAEAATMPPAGQTALVDSARLTFQYLSAWLKPA
jgi:heme oxygenase (biliverdin-IX-beta and delta-forming)